MKFIPFLIVFLFAFNSIVFSQADSFFLTPKVKICKDEKIDTLISRLYSNTDEKPTINGYRVQIYSGSVRKDALKVKSDFLEKYSSPDIYFDYDQPNYKVRIGDFRNKIEAQKLYHQLLNDGDFNAVLIVPDVIFLPEL